MMMDITSSIVVNRNFINKFIEKKIIEKTVFTVQSSKRHLTIIACHLNNHQRIQNIKQNIQSLSFLNNDIIIINSSNLLYNENVKNEIELLHNIKKYIEIPNDKWNDFGKWKYALNNIDYSNYDFITFTNDSFLILKPLLFYYNLAVSKNKEIYGYTSSSEVKYHLQSYLFTIKQDSIYKFKEYLTKKTTQASAKINAIHLELYLLDHFQSYDCFLDIGTFYTNKSKNIFFNNNLYNILYKLH